MESTAGVSVSQSVDLRWLEVFDSLYSGIPASDVPEVSFGGQWIFTAITWCAVTSRALFRWNELIQLVS